MIGFVSRVFVIGTAGGTGSGKTTVTEAVINAVGPEHLTLLPLDNYKGNTGLPFEERLIQLSYDHPDAFDPGLYLKQIRRIVSGRPISIPVDSLEYTRAGEPIAIQPAPVVVLEGIVLLGNATFRAQMNLKVLCIRMLMCALFDLRSLSCSSAGAPQRDLLERGRTTESMVKQYLEQVRPIQLSFVEPSQRYAGLITVHSGHKQEALAMLTVQVGNLVPAEEVGQRGGGS